MNRPDLRQQPTPALRRRTLRHALLLLLAVAGLIYLSLGYYLADRISTPPRHQPAEIPGVEAAAVETVTFQTPDDVELAAWWLPVHEARGTALLLHGYGGSRGREYVTAAIPIYHEADWQVLALDLRAHGESGGERSTGGTLEVKDAAAALAWLAEQGVATSEVLIHGWSMGGSVAIMAAAEHEVAGLITEAPFTRLDETLRHVLPRYGMPLIFYPGARLMAGQAMEIRPHQVRPVDHVTRLSAGLPMLLIHGSEDGVVPVSHAQAFHEARPETDLWILEGYGHMTAHQHPDYRQRLETVLAVVAGD